ncbi:unnamed protein product [Amoebophrya sp. A25]|nr:unnamed protein product [Amoebophrya sp. A25]|eukprot:GSA25T00011492001.1
MGQACSCCEDRNKSGNKGMMAKPGGANARKTASGETKLYEPSLKSELTYGGTDTVAAGLVSLSDDRRPALDLYYEQDDAARGARNKGPCTVRVAWLTMMRLPCRASCVSEVLQRLERTRSGGHMLLLVLLRRRHLHGLWSIVEECSNLRMKMRWNNKWR